MWDIEATDRFVEWYRSLGDDDAESVTAAVNKLEEQGPTLRRPFADTIKGSRHANM